MPRKAGNAAEPETELSAARVAALRKWLRVANARLLSLQRDREQLIAAASSLAHALGQPGKVKRQKRPKLAVALTKSG